MSFNTLIDWNGCNKEEQQALLMRPAISASDNITRTVAEILDNVKQNGDRAEVTALKVTEEEIAQASSRLSDELKAAMNVAVKNIDTFHTAQILPGVDIPYRLGGTLYSGWLRAAFLHRLTVARKWCSARHHRLPMKFCMPRNCAA
ncbi:hypothetical protein GCM10011445_04660 [Pseudocitrobacter faecalis]|nr:hypothetical protein GCM10011445_04660 [Pseudocitrobacter faecalis]